MSINLSELSTDQLKRALEIKEKIDALKLELSQVEGGEGAAVTVVAIAPASLEKSDGKRVVSKSARRKMAAAQKARWAKIRGETAQPAPAAKTAKRGKKTMSPEARAKISDAQKARWAKTKAGKA